MPPYRDGWGWGGLEVGDWGGGGGFDGGGGGVDGGGGLMVVVGC